MNLREQLKKALERARELKSAADSRDLTDDELAEVKTVSDQITDLREKIAKADQAKAMIDGFDLDQEGDEQDESASASSKGTSPGGGRLQIKDRREQADAVEFGQRFVKSEEYERFRKEYPSGIGSGSPVSIGRVKMGSMAEWYATRKALTSPQANVAPVRFPVVDQVDRDRLTLLDLISRGETAGNFEYVQVTGVTRNAKIVPEAASGTDDNALKPVSDMTTELADAKVYTYADGYDVTNQLLSDAPAFASYMNNELGYSLDSVIEDKLLNGSGASGEPKGILKTTGVQQVEYANAGDTMAQVKAIRSGITGITRLPGGTVQAIVLSPEDDEAIDLLQDANDRFYGQGPFGSGPQTLWGRPRVTSERLTPGEYLLGDFKQVALLDREGLSVLAFNQHKDYAQRNMTYVRAELRAAQVIWKPNRLAVVKEAAV